MLLKQHLFRTLCLILSFQLRLVSAEIGFFEGNSTKKRLEFKHKKITD